MELWLIKGWVQYYTVFRYNPPYTGKKECRGTFFLPVILGKEGVKIVSGYIKVIARVILAGKSVEVHSFFPVYIKMQ